MDERPLDASPATLYRGLGYPTSAGFSRQVKFCRYLTIRYRDVEFLLFHEQQSDCFYPVGQNIFLYIYRTSGNQFQKWVAASKELFS